MQLCLGPFLWLVGAWLAKENPCQQYSRKWKSVFDLRDRYDSGSKVQSPSRESSA